MAYKIHPNPQSLDTPQKIYDAVVEHLLSMDQPSFDEHHSCAYRSSDGENTCAVGFLIPQYLYYEKFEEKTCTVLLFDEINTPQFNYLDEETQEKVKLFARSMPHLRENSSLLRRLQQTHDDSGNWLEKGMSNRGKSKLNAIAVKFGLEKHPLLRNVD